jgi:hypothetical protein
MLDVGCRSLPCRLQVSGYRVSGGWTAGRLLGSAGKGGSVRLTGGWARFHGTFQSLLPRSTPSVVRACSPARTGFVLGQEELPRGRAPRYEALE